jgi:hypothetical protein
MMTQSNEQEAEQNTVSARAARNARCRSSCPRPRLLARGAAQAACRHTTVRRCPQPNAPLCRHQRAHKQPQTLEQAKVIEDKRKAEHAAAAAKAAAAAAAARKAAPSAAPKPVAAGLPPVVFSPADLIYPQVRSCCALPLLVCVVLLPSACVHMLPPHAAHACQDCVDTATPPTTTTTRTGVPQPGGARHVLPL